MSQYCINYEFCKNNKVPEMGSDYCMTCGSWFKYGFGWNKLTIIDSTDNCVICTENCSRKLLFPTNCGHSFCLSCSRTILFWDESRYHLSPVPYGCLPCPNGCINPEKGKQCDCEEYDAIQDQWRQNMPEKFKKWCNDQDKSMANSLNDIYGKGQCPLCRKVYTR